MWAILLCAHIVGYRRLMIVEAGRRRQTVARRGIGPPPRSTVRHTGWSGGHRQGVCHGRGALAQVPQPTHAAPLLYEQAQTTPPHKQLWIVYLQQLIQQPYPGLYCRHP